MFELNGQETVIEERQEEVVAEVQEEQKKEKPTTWYPPKPRKCCVPGCTADSKRSPELMFHYIPKREPKRSQWVRSMKITGFLNTRPVICSQHFKPDDYYPIVENQKAVRLKITAIPSIRVVKNIFDKELSEEEDPPMKVTRNRMKRDSDNANEDILSKIARYKQKVVPEELDLSPSKEPKKNFVLKIQLKDPKSKVNSPSKSRNYKRKKKSQSEIEVKSNEDNDDNFGSDFVPFEPCLELETTSPQGKLPLKTDATQQEDNVTTFIYMPKTSGDILRLLPGHIKINIPALKQESTDNVKPLDCKNPKIEKPDLHLNNFESPNTCDETDCIQISSDSDEEVDKDASDKKMNTNNQNGGSNSPHNGNLEKVSRGHHSSKCSQSETRVETITFCATCERTMNVDDEDLLNECTKSRKTVAAEMLLQVQEKSSPINFADVLLMKKGIKVCDDVLKGNDVCFMDLLKDNNDLMAFTGVTNKLLDSLIELMSRAESDSLKEYSKSVRERVLLCLCKIRTNLSFCSLAMLFKMSQRACANEFFTTTKTMSKILSNAVYWKKSFSESSLSCVPYKQTKVMLNCSEVKIEKKRCSDCHKSMLSQNQISDSVKFLLGIAPSGLIVYKSKTFDSKAHGSVFNHTDFLQLLDLSKEAIMIDESLDIDHDCAVHDVSIVRLPDLQENKEFSNNDVEMIKNISAVRIHINRSLQRFTSFRILQTQVPWRVVPYLDNICTIVGAIVNLQHPVLARDILMRVRKSLYGSSFVI
ncbi:hypothetical protein QAD02_015979 [Eretmocerus hayati]|uniref:Uncharacterized protein n=1 Tax=Eretmocerus hayati TaxID=131215 RepID=A0ACC2P9S8_9HYME|nr:hypothetical protein QAD02_015979 [Eretmocerus hayati]